MSSSTTLRSLSSGADPVLDDLIDGYAARLEAGHDLDVQECTKEHPEYADALHRLLPTMKVLAELGHSAPGSQPAEGAALSPAGPPSGTLGDFRLLRELGRGGMGVVYLAEQISLGRRVALKVLPFAATLDPRQLQRFHNEARAAACLQHPHIVAVFAVGCERAVNFYAMQFVDGLALDALFEQLRHANKPAAPDSKGEQPGPSAEVAPGRTVSPARAQASTLVSLGQGHEYYRRVAELMIQAAQALEHSHACGVLHRDVKPANLMIDERGKLWVTDFGLAQVQSNTRLTLTGDLVGTLRYMSPEQALAKRMMVDHRADIYSLGATLYEFLTLEPVFAGNDRQELLRQIAFEEPVSPRRHDKAIPADLETIVLKALQKNPVDRYATALEFAEDLERFVKDEPIRAQRPSLKRRLGKWCQRHKPFVTAAAAALFVGLIALTAGFLWYQDDQNRRATEQALGQAEAVRKTALAGAAIRTALDQADQSRQDLHTILKRPGGVFGLLNDPARWEAHIQASQAHLDRALALAANAGEGIDPDLSTRASVQGTLLRQDEADRLLAAHLEKIRLDQAVMVESKLDTKTAAREYPTAFAKSGYLVGEEQPATIAARIGASPIKEELLAALDDWAWVAFDLGQEGLPEQLLEIGRLAAPDPLWADRLRQTEMWRNQEALAQIVNEAPLSGLSPTMLALIGQLLGANNPLQEIWLRQATDLYPADFWLNFRMGSAIVKANPQEADGFFRVAIAVRPGSSVAYNNLGAAFQELKQPARASEAYQKAIGLDPNFGIAYYNLGTTLIAEKKLPEAMDACKKAISLDPNFAHAYLGLGYVFVQQKNLAKAIDAYNKAIEVDANYAVAYYNLGNTLVDAGKLPEAIDAYNKAIDVDPNYAGAYVNLGQALRKQKKLPEAIDAFRMAIKLDPKLAIPYNNLGHSLREQNKLPEAVAAYNKAIELDPEFALAYSNLGLALQEQKKLAEAIVAYRKAIALNPNFANAYSFFADALREQKKLPEAIAACNKAIELDPKNFVGYQNLGKVLFDQKKLPEAIAAYDKAIELDPNNAFAYYDLGNALREHKKLPEAVEAFRMAIKINPNYAFAYNNLGNVLRKQQKLPEAIAAFRKVIELGPNYAFAYSNLGIALHDQNNLPEAIAAYRKAIELNPKDALGYYNLGKALREQKKLPEAILVYQKATELKPEFAEAHCNLGSALQAQGRFAEALTSYKRGHELGSRNPNWPYPSTEWVRKGEQLVRLDAKLPKVLSGEVTPADATERLDLANLCQLPCRQLYAAAAQFFSEAFAAEPKLADDVTNGNRYDAACAAARAGVGQGKDDRKLDAGERAHLRAKALLWLQSDLAAWRSMLETDPGKAAPPVREKMLHWQNDLDLNGVRGADTLAKLPDTERHEWQKLWEDVEALRKRAAD